MTNSDVLQDALARPVLDQAYRAAFRGRYGEAEQHLAIVGKISPQMFEVSLLTAKIRLREGRLSDCRAALMDARRLGHPVAESDAMMHWLEEHATRQASDPDQHSGRASIPSAHQAPNLARLGSTVDVLTSIRALRVHLTRHPDCAIGRARMAEALARKAMYWGGSPQMLSEAEAQANRAIAIAPLASEAHASLGFVYGTQGAVLDAERKLRRAVALDADNWFALHQLGSLLVRQGVYEAGLHALTDSIERQPLFLPSYDAIYKAYLGLGDQEGAAQVLVDGLSCASDRLRAAPDDLFARAHHAILLARKGMRAESMEIVNQLTERFPKSGSAWAHGAIAHAVNGELDQAGSALRTAQKRGYDIRQVASLAEFDAMRGADAFVQLGL